MVQSGPFAGLKLPAAGSWGNLAPLLVGCYEEELHSVLEEVIAAAPRCVVNVGCAEGYYAAGLARRLPGATVYAFDVDEQAQQLTRETASLNSVGERLKVAGECTVERLEDLLAGGALLIMDCEGCEHALLRPDCVPSLRTATVLVELHDHVDAAISSTILARFSTTHSVRVVQASERVHGHYPALVGLKRSDRAVAVDELRPAEPPAMEWAVLRPLRV